MFACLMACLISPTAVPELTEVEPSASGLTIGGAVTLAR